MMLSLSATCDSVKCGSPFVRLDHTNTIAVQGRGSQDDEAGDVAVDLVGGR